jgi:hypothetical protein
VAHTPQPRSASDTKGGHSLRGHPAHVPAAHCLPRLAPRVTLRTLAAPALLHKIGSEMERNPLPIQQCAQARALGV